MTFVEQLIIILMYVVSLVIYSRSRRKYTLLLV